jgi:hypothetical protein
MKPPIHFVQSFEHIGPWTLRVHFEDGTSQQIDFRPVLHGPLFGPLQAAGLFSQVRLDSEVRTLVWPNGADFDPATLYDWPEEGPLLSAKAHEWEAAGSLADVAFR